MLSLYRQLIKLRRTNEALSVGDFRLLNADGDVFAYERCQGSARFLVALNFAGASRSLAIPDGSCGVIEISTIPDRSREQIASTLTLESGEGAILRLG
jgi:alpha-glucosidase